LHGAAGLVESCEIVFASRSKPFASLKSFRTAAESLSLLALALENAGDLLGEPGVSEASHHLFHHLDELLFPKENATGP